MIWSRTISSDTRFSNGCEWRNKKWKKWSPANSSPPNHLLTLDPWLVQIYTIIIKLCKQRINKMHYFCKKSQLTQIRVNTSSSVDCEIPQSDILSRFLFASISLNKIDALKPSVGIYFEPHFLPRKWNSHWSLESGLLRAPEFSRILWYYCGCRSHA